MPNERHCATCRCSVTITGQIAAFLETQPMEFLTYTQIAKAVGCSDASAYETAVRMARDGKILRRGRKFSAIPLIDEFREAMGKERDDAE